MTLNTKDNYVNTSRVSKCPVCVGKGRVPHGFYAVDTHVKLSSTIRGDWEEVCRSCYGKGIIIH